MGEIFTAQLQHQTHSAKRIENMWIHLDADIAKSSVVQKHVLYSSSNLTSVTSIVES